MNFFTNIFTDWIRSFSVVCVSFAAQTITEAHMAAMMPRLLPPAWRGKPLVPWRPLAPGMDTIFAMFSLELKLNYVTLTCICSMALIS
jgi:hypothetical protein